MADFKPGDVVKLKSGSPKMTVTGTSDRGDLITVWFDGMDPKRDGFNPRALSIVKESGE